MSMELPTIIEGGIPVLGGLYATALGHGVIRLSRSLPSPFVQKVLLRFRWLGPALVRFGVFTAWQTHLHVNHPPAEEIVRQITARLSFPVKVDDITRAMGVQGKGDEITYDYSIAAHLDKSWRAATGTRQAGTAMAQCRLQNQRLPNAPSRGLYSADALLVSGVSGRDPGFHPCTACGY